MPQKLMQPRGLLGAATRPYGRNTEILRKTCLVLFVSLLLATSGFAQQSVSIQTGLPVNFATLTLHVHGPNGTMVRLSVRGSGRPDSLMDTVHFRLPLAFMRIRSKKQRRK